MKAKIKWTSIHLHNLAAAILTIISSGCMLYGAVYGISGEQINPWKAMIGGFYIGGSVVGFYSAIRLMKFWE